MDDTNEILNPNTNDGYPANDFMQPGSYAYALSYKQKSLQVFPPFNSINNSSNDLNSESENKVSRPYIQHFARLNTPVSTIRAFPFGDNFAIGTINTIYIASNKLEPTFTLPKNESTIIKNIDVHPSSIFLACDGPADHNTIRIVSLQNRLPIMELNKHRKKVSSILFFTSVCKIFSTSFDGTFIISDFIKKRECYRYSKYEGKNAITTSSIKNDESIISIGFDNGNVGIFDHRESEGMISLKDSHTSWVNSLCFSPVKCYMATNSIDKSLRVWDLRYLDEPLFKKDNLDTNLSKVLFLNDSVLAGASTKGELIQWDFNNSTILRFDKIRDFGLYEMDIQREPNRIIVSSEDTVVSMFYYHLSY